MDSVNADDAFGHGYFDGYSIVAGHEYAEAVTDPGNQNGTQNGWNDAQTSENGDKWRLDRAAEHHPGQECFRRATDVEQ